ILLPVITFPALRFQKVCCCKGKSVHCPLPAKYCCLPVEGGKALKSPLASVYKTVKSPPARLGFIILPPNTLLPVTFNEAVFTLPLLLRLDTLVVPLVKFPFTVAFPVYEILLPLINQG